MATQKLHQIFHKHTLTEHFIRNSLNFSCIPQDVGNVSLRFWSMLRRLHDIISADLSAVHSCCESPVLPHPKGGVFDSYLVTQEVIEVH